MMQHNSMLPTVYRKITGMKGRSYYQNQRPIAIGQVDRSFNAYLMVYCDSRMLHLLDRG